MTYSLNRLMVTKAKQPDLEIPLSRRERRGEQTRQCIFQKALELFAKRGFTNVTIEEITDAADVGKGTFFNYFPTKEHLFTAMAEMQIGKVKAAAEAAQQATQMRPLLEQLALNLAAGPSKTPLLLSSMLSVVLSHKTLKTLLGNGLGLGRERLATIMTRGQELGEIRTDMQAYELARVFQRFVFGS